MNDSKAPQYSFWLIANQNIFVWRIPNDPYILGLGLHLFFRETRFTFEPSLICISLFALSVLA